MTPQHPTATTRIAMITGASRGFGLALAGDLADHGWNLLITARGRQALAVAESQLAARTTVHAIPGDVADPAHRTRLARVVAEMGGLDLLVNNASLLGPSPLPRLAEVDPDDLVTVLEVNVVAPLALFQAVRPHLESRAGTVVNLSSDAATGDWEGWGTYGSSKAALDRISAVLAVEHPDLAVFALDPGDMRTAMYQAAFPGEDISDRPDPTSVVPAIRQLVDRRPPSGRYRAADLLAQVAA